MKNLLFERYDFNGIDLKNRIVMAPMTRSRTTQPGDIPNDLMAEYYSQRVGAGLIITEATQISKQGQGYSYTPGIYSKDQINGWKIVTKKIHENNGKIFLQLWHVGRMSHESFHEDGMTVGPSAISPNASVWVADENGKGEMVPCPTPRELKIEEIEDIINDYSIAAVNAKTAGFDGIEIHAANGYLLDSFLRSSSNHRNDKYGGNMENRIRLVKDVVLAIGEKIGFKNIGIRLSPHNISRGMDCPEMIETTYALIETLNKLNIGYIHFAEADWDSAPEVPKVFRKKVRSIFNGNIIVAGKYDRFKAEKIINDGLADLVAFGRGFIANPDFVQKIKNGVKLEEYDDTKLFGGNYEGYTDYK